MTSPSRRRLAIAFWIFAGFVAWNGAFDVLVSRGIKEYLYQAARSRLGERPPVTMGQIMARTVHDAWPISTAWALAVTGAGLATIGWTGRREATEN